MKVLNQEQLKKVRVYLNHLNTFRIKIHEIPSDEILKSKYLFYEIIEELGNGDPIKAAEKHGKAMIGLNKSISLSSSDENEAIH